MLNRIVVVGRLGKDPEVRTTTSGTQLAKFSLAVDRDRKDREGNKQTDWFNVAVFGRTVEFVEARVHKGDLIAVEGRCQIDNYTDRDGNKRTSVEINADNVQKLVWENDGEGSDRGARDDRGGDRDGNSDRGGNRDRGRGRDDDDDRDRDRDRGGRSGGSGDRDRDRDRGRDRDDRDKPRGGDDEFTDDKDDPFGEE